MTNPNWLNQHDNDTNVDYRGHIVLPSRDGTRIAGGGTGAIGPDGLNIPSKPTQHAEQGPNTQAGRRWTDTFYDMHRTGPSGRFPNGRPWCGERELAANPDLKHEPGFVTTDLMQGAYVASDDGQVDRRATFESVWRAPWVPLAKYFVFNYKRKLITFGYQRMLTEEQFAHDQYFEAAAVLGSGLNIAVEYGKIPPFAITAKLGSPLSAIRNIKIAQAAMAGDPWLLGFVDEPNGELAKLLGYNERTGLRMMSYTPEPKGVVTPEQVLATPPHDLQAMIADAVAKALAAERAAVAAKNAAKGEQLRAGKKKNEQKRQTQTNEHAPVAAAGSPS